MTKFCHHFLFATIRIKIYIYWLWLNASLERKSPDNYPPDFTPIFQWQFEQDLRVRVDIIQHLAGIFNPSFPPSNETEEHCFIEQRFSMRSVFKKFFSCCCNKINSHWAFFPFNNVFCLGTGELNFQCNQFN